MERLTDKLRDLCISCELGIDDECYFLNQNKFCKNEECYNRLDTIEDILGDNYDLARLRQLVDADRDGLCVVLPCKPGDILRNKGHDCEADHWNIVLTAFSKSEYTKSGKNIHLLSVQEAAEAVLEGRYQNEDC